MEAKNVIKALQMDGTTFTITGIIDAFGDPRVFKIAEFSSGDYSIHTKTVGGMNISKFGTRKFYVYDYNPIGKKSTGTVLYDDIDIIQIGRTVL